MGACASSSKREDSFTEENQVPVGKNGKYKRPRWTSDEPITREQFDTMRATFWDTQPLYGGQREIWDTLKAACECEDMETARVLLDAAGVIVSTTDMTVCYDERGGKYDLPKYVLSEPTNLTG